MAHVQCAKVISASKFTVFDYLTSPGHLAEQLSGIIDVKWQNPGVDVKPGSEFLFTMSRFGIEQPIRFVVDRMVHGNSLTYRQVSGVYAKFTHTMKFEDHGNGETLVTDLLDYEVPFGLIGKLADDFFIKNDLLKILEARLNRTYERFQEIEKKGALNASDKDLH